MKKQGLYLEESTRVKDSNKEENYIKIEKGLYISKLSSKKEKIITIKYEEGVDIENTIRLVQDSINELLKEMSINKNSNILFIGLGNKEVSVDKLGYLTIEKIVTNQMKIYKDTMKVTNINTLKFIKALVKELNIDLVVLIDSLNTKEINNIGKIIEISNSKLLIGEDVISKKTIKAPLITIGVPLILEEEKLIITKEEINELVENNSSIISLSINRLL